VSAREDCCNFQRRHFNPNLADSRRHFAFLAVPDGLRAIGGYIRPAGGSLGLVIDTPRLDTDRPFINQGASVDVALSKAADLKAWWDAHGAALRVHL
jgi:hypothetical protein